MRKIFNITLFLAFIATMVVGEELSGRDILEKAIKRYRGDDSVMTMAWTKSRMDNPSNKNSFEMTAYGLVRPEVRKALIAIKRAKSKASKPILFLLWDWQDNKQEDQLWFCLPSIGKYTKLSAKEGEKQAEQFGLSFEEIKVRDLDKAKHTNEGLVDFEGEKCYKVVSLPNNPQKEGASKFVTYIRPNSWTLAYAEAVGLDGKPTLKVRITKIQKINGIWTEMAGEQHNYEKKYSVNFEVKNVEYNQRLSSKLFSFTEPPQEVLEGN